MSVEIEQEEIPYRPGLEKVPVAISKICYLDGDRGVLEYRGCPIENLAGTCSYEETAFLLLFGALPEEQQLSKFKCELSQHRRLKFRIVDMMKALPDAGHPMHALVSAISAMAMFYPGKYHDLLDPAAQEDRRDACVKLIAKLPTAIAAWHRIRNGDLPISPRDDLSHAANFLYMLQGFEPDPDLARAFDACLVLHAEHELNASTFAARVTGSALADPYGVVAAAVGTLHGPLHGGANERVLAMLRDIGTPEAVEGWVEQRLAKKKVIWGIGHREYRVKDPRATILQELNEQVFTKLGRTPLYDIAVRLEEVLLVHPKFGAAPTQRQKKFPNVDFYSGIVYEKMGIAVDIFTPIFAMARVAGWLAHYLEQVETKGNKIFRPKQIYVGERKVEVRPADERS